MLYLTCILFLFRILTIFVVVALLIFIKQWDSFVFRQIHWKAVRSNVTFLFRIQLVTLNLRCCRSVSRLLFPQNLLKWQKLIGVQKYLIVCQTKKMVLHMLVGAEKHLNYSLACNSPLLWVNSTMFQGTEIYRQVLQIADCKCSPRFTVIPATTRSIGNFTICQIYYQIGRFKHVTCRKEKKNRLHTWWKMAFSLDFWRF